MATPSAAGVLCPQCGRRYRWKPELAGRKLLCACGLKMRLPAEPGGAPIALAGAETRRAAAAEADPAPAPTRLTWLPGSPPRPQRR